MAIRLHVGGGALEDMRKPFQTLGSNGFPDTYWYMLKIPRCYSCKKTAIANVAVLSLGLRSIHDFLDTCADHAPEGCKIQAVYRSWRDRRFLLMLTRHELVVGMLCTFISTFTAVVTAILISK